MLREWIEVYGEIRLGDIVRMRKPHPCGSVQWEVVRLGADVGIRCCGCGRRVLMPRSQFSRRVKALVSRQVMPDGRKAEQGYPTTGP